MVGPVQHVETPRVARVGVIDGAVRLLVEDADARGFGNGERAVGVVVVRLSSLEFLRGEGDVIVPVEVVAERRHPPDAPAMRFLYASSVAMGARETSAKL